MYQWKDIQSLLRVKAVEQANLTQREREVWRESFERAYEQAASLLPLDLQEGRAGRQVGGTDHATQ